MHRIEALIHPDNVASIRLVERLGFRCEGGPLRDRWRRGGLYERDDVCAHRRRANRRRTNMISGRSAPPFYSEQDTARVPTHCADTGKRLFVRSATARSRGA